MGSFIDGYQELSPEERKQLEYLMKQEEQVPDEEPKDKVLKYFNIRDNSNTDYTDDQILLMVYLVSCLVPDIPHLVIILAGEKGSAKSTAMRVLRKLVDPAIEELLSLPNNHNDIGMLLATNYCPYFDNLDGITFGQSDLLCRGVTGGGISKRKLFTDDEEVIMQFKRCIALNGINPAATRADLLDRSIIITLDRIGPSNRKTEEEFWNEFEQDRPLIFGAMLDTLSKAMSIYPKVKLDRYPRMADFTKWGYAIAEAAGIGGDRFLQAYYNAIAAQNNEALQAHPVAAAILVLMQDKPYWVGTATQLLKDLENAAEEEKINIRAKSWPKAANTLTRRLREVKSNLAEIGITVEDDRTPGGNRQRIIKLSKNIDNTSSQPSQSYECRFNAGSNRDDTGTVSKKQLNTVPDLFSNKPLYNGHRDDRDNRDGSLTNHLENQDWSLTLGN